MIGKLKDKIPRIHDSVFMASSAVVIGDVVLEEQCSVWYGAVIRGDGDSISIGRNTNIQDNAVLHVDAGAPLSIGRGVVVGHGAIVHGCTVGDNCVIGMGSIIMNHAQIGENSVVGAGTLISEGKSFPPNSVIVGNPARAIKKVTPEILEKIKQGARHYVEMGELYREELEEI